MIKFREVFTLFDAFAALIAGLLAANYELTGKWLAYLIVFTAVWVIFVLLRLYYAVLVVNRKLDQLPAAVQALAAQAAVKSVVPPELKPRA